MTKPFKHRVGLRKKMILMGSIPSRLTLATKRRAPGRSRSFQVDPAAQKSVHLHRSFIAWLRGRLASSTLVAGRELHVQAPTGGGLITGSCTAVVLFCMCCVLCCACGVCCCVRAGPLCHAALGWLYFLDIFVCWRVCCGCSILSSFLSVSQSVFMSVCIP